MKLKVRSKDASTCTAHKVLDEVSNGVYYDPHEVLGAHLIMPVWGQTVRQGRPSAIRMGNSPARQIVRYSLGTAHKAEHEWNGIFIAEIPAVKDGERWTVPITGSILFAIMGNIQDDPYRYLPTVVS